MQQSGDGRIGAAQVCGRFGQRPALQVMQDHRFALTVRQGTQGIGQSQQFFIPNGLSAG